ncbi:MAG: YbjQ family protein [Anaerolineales bacterium]|nr:MAG: YbjQ family protein [Anaerolineales bacterium]
MIVTTTPGVEGRAVKEYLGVIAGEAILGTHFGRDIAASLSNFFGGRSAAYEEEVQKARHIASEEMVGHAARLGADAVVGVDIDYEVIRDGMMMVAVSGTAVKLG